MTEKAKEIGEQNAFPLKFDNGNGVKTIHYGMNLREYYAGLAMQGMLSNPNFIQETRGCGCSREEYCSHWAIEMANTLLEGLSIDL